MIILFGAIPATVALLIFWTVAFFMYRLQVFGPGAFSAVLSVVSLIMATWGAFALWFAPTKPITRTNTVGLALGLVVWAPFAYAAFFNFAETPFKGFVLFGWILLPVVVATVLLSARLYSYLRNR